MWLREFCGRWCFRAIMFYALYAAGFPPIIWMSEYKPLWDPVNKLFASALICLGPIWFLMFMFAQGYDE